MNKIFEFFYRNIFCIFSKALGTNNEPKRSEMLAMLAIPADVACRELINFIYPA